MIEGIEIVDGHMHIFTATFSRRIEQHLDSRSDRYRHAVRLWHDRFMRKYNSELGEENDDPPEKIAHSWAEELDKHGVDKAVFVSLYPDDNELTAFVNSKPNRFFAFATVDPKDPRAPELLRRRVEQERYVGLKLYPTTTGFLHSDRSIYPVYEECRYLGIPVLFHLGITLEYDSDLRFANPIELHPVLKDFPDIPFIVAHFGAGYFREVLLLAYHVNNLYVDTSGKNLWSNYLPYRITLAEVFQRSLEVLGPERLIFGTDSRMLSRGYRKVVLEEQLAILRKLELSNEEISLIMGANMMRLIKEQCDDSGH